MSARNVESLIGTLGLRVEEGFLTEIAFGGLPEEGGDDPLLDRTQRQLAEYFAGTRREFDLPLNPHGTPFQRKVWDALRQIPYGETRSYGDIARAVGSPKGFRAVGMANHVNPIPVVIPCHRVVGSKGALTGYAGGLNIKSALLELEKASLTKKT